MASSISPRQPSTIPWVKRFRLIAFLAATFIVSQLLFHEVLALLGMGSLIPSSALAVLVASGVWLEAYPTMWLRVLTVFAEMEAKKEFEDLLRTVERLHHPKGIADRPASETPAKV